MSTTRKDAGNLKRWATKHPFTTFLLTDNGGCTAVNALFSGGYTKLAEYSRERDAKRALRDLGYTQEGRYWRKVPIIPAGPTMQGVKDETTVE